MRSMCWTQGQLSGLRTRRGNGVRPLTLTVAARAARVGVRGLTPFPHIARGGKKMSLVHEKGMKARLPKVPAPILAEVDAPGVAPASFADGAVQPVSNPRGPGRDARGWASSSTPKPRLLPAGSAGQGDGDKRRRRLRRKKVERRRLPRPCDVMGNAGNDDARDAGHGTSMAHGQTQPRKIVYRPRNCRRHPSAFKLCSAFVRSFFVEEGTHNPRVDCSR